MYMPVLYFMCRFDVTKNAFNWSIIKAKRDAYVKRLNGIYANNLSNDKIEHLHGWGKFTGKGKGNAHLNKRLQ